MSDASPPVVQPLAPQPEGEHPQDGQVRLGEQPSLAPARQAADVQAARKDARQAAIDAVQRIQQAIAAELAALPEIAEHAIASVRSHLVFLRGQGEAQLTELSRR